VLFGTSYPSGPQIKSQLDIRFDYGEAEKLFFRLLDDPSVVISRGFEANFEEPTNDQEHCIKRASDVHRAWLATKLERHLFSQETRRVNAERSLGDKETKKARDDVRIATIKIETLTMKLADLRRTETKSRDNRIFPMVYAGILVKQGRQTVLTPMRYCRRPAGKPAFYDKKFPGLYNARRDNLEKSWADQLGSHHAVMVVQSFYDNVKRHALEHRALQAEEQETNVPPQFTPEPPQTTYIACLWSHGTDPKRTRSARLCRHHR
jgi:hypothetical protein